MAESLEITENDTRKAGCEKPWGQGWWLRPVIPAFWEAKGEGSLSPGVQACSEPRDCAIALQPGQLK